MKQIRSAAARRGAMIQESLMAIVITAAMLVGIAQVLTRIVQQRHVAQQHTMARHAAANLMEDAMSRSWAQITTDQLAQLQPLDAPRTLLVDANYQLEVFAEDERDTVKRIQVQIAWPDATGRRDRHFRLVAWRYRTLEATP